MINFVTNGQKTIDQAINDAGTEYDNALKQATQ